MKRLHVGRKAPFLIVILSLISSGMAQAALGLPENCDPDPKVATSFCVSSAVNMTDGAARAPFDVSLSADNTSTNRNSDTNVWVDTVTLDLPKVGGSIAKVTRSTEMENNAVLAGGGTCTGPAFTNCVAGYGTVDAWVSGTGGFFDGFRQGSFGINQIRNVNPPAPGLYLDAVVDVSYCFTFSSTCDINGTTTVPLKVHELTGGPVTSMTFELFNHVVPQNHPPCGCNPEADTTLGQLTVNLNGVADGPTEDPAFLVLPARCGTSHGGVNFTSHDQTTPKTVSFTDEGVVSQCPAAAFNHDINGYKVSFDGSSSSTPVAGRNLAKYKWNFGDGRRKTTSTSIVNHIYKKSDDYTVKLKVVDSSGAISSVITDLVLGSKTTLGVDKLRVALKAKGKVRPAHDSGKVKLDLFVRKNGGFDKVQSKTVSVNDNSRYSAKLKRPNANTCRIDAGFTGHNDHLASEISKKVDC